MPRKYLHVKPCIHTHGCVANPCDSTDYRCGFRFALGVNSSVHFMQLIPGQDTSRKTVPSEQPSDLKP